MSLRHWIFLALLFGSAANAADNTAIKDGSGATVTLRSINCTGSIQCPASVLVDPAGNPLPLAIGATPTYAIPTAISNGVPTTGPGTAGTSLVDIQGSASGIAVPVKLNAADGPFPVDTSGTRATYGASMIGLVPYSTATDLLTIPGSATMVVRVTRLQLSCIATAAAAADVSLILRSTADSNGTSTTPPEPPFDNTSPAASVAIKAYTVNPTSLGTSIGTIRSSKIAVGTSGGSATPLVFTFGDQASQPIILRGTANNLAVNLGGNSASITGCNWDAQWTEANS